MNKFWVCVIEVDEKENLPMGFDNPPRHAAIEACEKNSVAVLNCWSGWGCDEKTKEKIMDAWNTYKVGG